VIISHKHKYIYIKNAKVGGSSVEQYLSLHVGPDDILTPIGEEGPLSAELQATYGRPTRFQNQGDFWDHASLLDVQRSLGPQIIDEYFVFCVDRHPEDKALSCFFFLKNRDATIKTVEDFVAARRTYQSNFFRYSLGGVSRADQIIRFETLDEDLGQICERLKLPYDGQLQFQANAGIRDRSKRIEDIFTEDQIMDLWRHHALENQHLGYRDPSEFDPKGAYARRQAALLLSWEDRDEEALAAMGEAISLDPNEAPLYGFQCRLLRAAGRYIEAEEAISKALALDEDEPRYHLALAQLAFRRKDLPLAVKSAQQVKLLGGETDQNRGILTRILSRTPA